MIDEELADEERPHVIIRRSAGRVEAIGPFGTGDAAGFFLVEFLGDDPDNFMTRLIDPAEAVQQMLKPK